MTRLIGFCRDVGTAVNAARTLALHKHGSPVPAQMAGTALGQSAQEGLPEPAARARQTLPALPRTASPLPLFWHAATDSLFHLSVTNLIN